VSPKVGPKPGAGPPGADRQLPFELSAHWRPQPQSASVGQQARTSVVGLSAVAQPQRAGPAAKLPPPVVDGVADRRVDQEKTIGDRSPASALTRSIAQSGFTGGCRW